VPTTQKKEIVLTRMLLRRETLESRLVEMRKLVLPKGGSLTKDAICVLKPRRTFIELELHSTQGKSSARLHADDVSGVEPVVLPFNVLLKMVRSSNSSDMSVISNVLVRSGKTEWEFSR